jgi:hypothetical protein
MKNHLTAFVIGFLMYLYTRFPGYSLLVGVVSKVSSIPFRLSVSCCGLFAQILSLRLSYMGLLLQAQQSFFLLGDPT